jgi:shikimate dehydrogenase
VAHSLSPAIFAAAFAAAGIDGTYEVRSVNEEGVRTAFQELSAGELDGINVTMPHKALAASLCDRLDPQALRAGSVNTVVNAGDERVGYSTDIDGILECWRAFPADRPVLILGGGGAAAAAVVALSSYPLSDLGLYISTRRFGQGSELGARVGAEVGEIRWGVPVVGAIVMNCTPLGMKGEELPAPLLDLAGGLFDLAYARRSTPAVASMTGKGLPVADGLDLLVSQAGYGFRLFTGVEPPLAAMRAAVETPKAG